MAPAPPRRPAAVLFDVNGTLFDLAALRPQLVALGLPPTALEWWFAVVLRDGFALDAADDPRPFAAVAAGALTEVLERCLVAAAPATVAAVVDGLTRLAPFPDAAAALDRLRSAGAAAVALTNGGLDAARGLVARGGLESRLDDVWSVTQAGHWKPRPEPYRWAAERTGVDPVALVAAHPWDVHGASRAGLVTGWVNRGGATYPATHDRPAVTGGGLVDVVDRLLELPVAP